MLITSKNNFDAVEFKEKFLNKETLVYRNAIKSWPAITKWQPEYFSQQCPDIPVVVKRFSEMGVDSQFMSMKDYISLISQFKADHGDCSDHVPPYCHDIPLFLMAPHLVKDIGELPLEILPNWYAGNWSRYVQFFMSAKGSVTPLHFDTLKSHNLFFQIKGSKRFTIITGQNEKYCYRRDWRWFNIDPESPDYQRFPKYKRAEVSHVQVNAGDMFYMPPGTLHHVRSLDDCISFNIDFHTFNSVFNSFLAIPKGMPKENIYYNLLSLMGLLSEQNGDRLFEKYKKYLNYIS